MTLPPALSTVADPLTPQASTDAPPPVPDRYGRLLTVLVVGSIAFFALLGIGSPLIGQSVFAATDEMMLASPYREVSELAGTRPTNNYLDDTWDSALPNELLFAEELRDGEIAAWNPYTAAGVPLGATPNYALASPLTVPFYVLPGWFAPGVMKLLEIVVAVGGMYLFLRRLRVRPSAAALGGLAFASSAFLVVWTNWPQTRVAAFIPAVFWAAELIVQRRRVRDATVLALAVAAMLVGGFPAVTGYTLATAACYFLVRLWCTRPGVVRGLLTAAGGLAGGVLLAAVQLVPWVVLMRTAWVEGRGQTPEDHLAVASLVTAFAPWALGSTNPDGPVYWYLPINLVESASYVGAAALVLALAGVAMAVRARATLPGGAWAFLVVATGGWVLLIYGGGFPLGLAQRLPFLFSDNFVGRARCILGFLVAVLVAVGLELLLQRRAAASPSAAPSRRWALAWAALVWGGAGLGLLIALRSARRAAYRADRGDGGVRLDHLTQEVAIGAALVVAALACVAALWWLGRRAAGPHGTERRGDVLRLLAAGLLPMLVAGQALSFVIPYWPRADRDTFYPVTDTHEFLAAHLGHERYASLNQAMERSVDSVHKLRSATGHAFTEQGYGELIRSIPGARGYASTNVAVANGTSALGNRVLDRTGVRYGVAALDAPVPGAVQDAPAATGTTTLTSTAVTVTVPGRGGIRAVQVTPVDSSGWAATDRIAAVVRDAGGREIARTDRRIMKTTAEEPLTIPVAAEDVPASARLTVSITVTAADGMDVRTAGGRVALGVIRTADDGLRIAYIGSTIIYERETALPRVRWASDPVVEPDGDRRLALLSGDTLRADQVVLDAPAGAGGGTADVAVGKDGPDTVEVSVTARGSGYLVLADPVQHGWRVAVDGKAATLLPADHAFVAVAIPDGAHTVRFSYASAYGNIGTWLTLATGLAIGGVWAAGAVRDRRRRGTEVAS
ncbi:YfhO family protein [Actinomycetes bacterium KLBMP 9797]